MKLEFPHARWLAGLMAAAVLTGCNLDNNKDDDKNDDDNDQGGGGQAEVWESRGTLMLAGGHLTLCSSMAQSYCNDWDTYRSTELAHLSDDEIRVPVIEGVVLSDAKINDVLSDPAWDTNTVYAEAADAILTYLQSQQELYTSWDDFRSAFIAVPASEVNVTDGDGNDLDGNTIWFNASDAQWSTFDRLKEVDDTFQYTVTQAKVDAAMALTDVVALEAELKTALSTALDEQVFDDPVLQLEFIDYFGDINVVDATVNGWKLYKKWLSDAEYFFMLDTLDPEDDGTHVINAANISTIENDSTVAWDEQNRSDLVTVLQHLLDEAGEDITYATRDDFKAAFTDVYLDGDGNALNPTYTLGSDAWDALETSLQYQILRELVNPLTDYERPLERIALEESTSQDAIDVIKAVVEKAKGDSDEAPTILVMTSSSNDSYDAVDFYTDIFNQAGANAQWLPVDRAFQDAQASGRCDLLPIYHGLYANHPHLDALYPDHAQAHQNACENPASVLSMIEDADALFINGGGQRRSLDALMPEVSAGVREDSDAMALIRQRFNDGDLIVGGTSAGTAVQGGGSLNDDGFTIPMIDGGTAHDVLVDGYDSGIAVFEGGLGLFDYGITDTHFSERARETRLVKLAQQTGVRFGFGVDETTALIVERQENTAGVERARMNVIGAGGVYITDLGDATQTSADGQPLAIEGVVTHFLTHGDGATFTPHDGEFDFDLADGKTEISVDTGVATVTNDDVIYEDNYRQMATTMVANGAADATGTSYENDPTYEVNLSRTGDSVGYADTSGRVSYIHFQLDLSPQN
ncbi:cyanophycinase [Saccharospirillum salsuginis]|uniref:Cyanophycinase n=1 Tax=Saccharospirillum salsuginis TaxID=418750 RepID=A0A918JYE7_9GAMM|nr:cyanophycinase [Saccharospirillum salsuginis]GGX38158.1 hypothetical protein GCM10007392_00330 [Saccharospirillum salsuginis]